VVSRTRRAAWVLPAVFATVLALGSAQVRAQHKARDAVGIAESPCTLTATSDKSEVAVGQPFAVEVRCAGPAGVTWTFPPEAGNENVELRAAAVGPGTAPAETFRYNAAAFAVGETQVPAIEAKCRLTDGSEHAARSMPLTLRMVSILPKDPREQKLADIQPPVGLAIGRAFWIVLSVVVAACGAMAYVVLRRMRRGASGPTPVVEMTPDVEARAALARVGQEDWIARGDYRGFYIVLAQIAKRYLERRLAAPILEMTSSETLAFLRRRENAADCVVVVRDLTAAADQVKFADARGNPEEAARHLRATGELIDRVEDKLRRAEEAARGQAA
jgi:hypothetical protein